MCFIVKPLAFVDVAVSVDQSTAPVRHVVVPVTFVLGAVGPELLATAAPQSFVCPLALVDRAVV
jgi:hypothetical protein